MQVLLLIGVCHSFSLPVVFLSCLLSVALSFLLCFYFSLHFSCSRTPHQLFCPSIHGTKAHRPRTTTTHQSRPPQAPSNKNHVSPPQRQHQPPPSLLPITAAKKTSDYSNDKSSCSKKNSNENNKKSTAESNHLKAKHTNHDWQAQLRQPGWYHQRIRSQAHLHCGVMLQRQTEGTM